MPTSSAVFSGLISRGFSPSQAAALAGNIQQESNFNPAALNKDEGAFGLLQWRLDRRKALEDFAARRGTGPADLGTQLDFIRQEMGGPEAKSAAPFLASDSLPAANAALRKYIRYGDDSETTRLGYARKFLKESDMGGGLFGDVLGKIAPGMGAPGGMGGGSDMMAKLAALFGGGQGQPMNILPQQAQGAPPAAPQQRPGMDPMAAQMMGQMAQPPQLQMPQMPMGMMRPQMPGMGAPPGVPNFAQMIPPYLRRA